MRIEGTSRTKWTAEEERRLLELRAAGRSDAEIAKLLGRTAASVSNRIFRLRSHGLQRVAEGRLRRG
jgi:DNA-directed RNA polymerase specialized sigma24 family protein